MPTSITNDQQTLIFNNPGLTLYSPKHGGIERMIYCPFDLFNIIIGFTLILFIDRLYSLQFQGEILEISFLLLRYIRPYSSFQVKFFHDLFFKCRRPCLMSSRASSIPLVASSLSGFSSIARFANRSITELYDSRE